MERKDTAKRYPNPVHLTDFRKANRDAQRVPYAGGLLQDYISRYISQVAVCIYSCKIRFVGRKAQSILALTTPIRVG